MSRRLVEGQTGPVDKQLLVDGVALDLTGCTVTLVLKTKAGVLVDTAGNVSVLDLASGKVRYSPDTGDLVAANSPYLAHVRVVDGVGKTHYFPSGPAENWTVHRA